MPTITVTVSSLNVGISTITPIASINNNLAEGMLPIGLPIATVIRNREETTTVLLAGIIDPKITYAKTDGEPITTGTGAGGGTYWVTG